MMKVNEVPVLTCTNKSQWINLFPAYLRHQAKQLDMVLEGAMYDNDAKQQEALSAIYDRLLFAMGSGVPMSSIPKHFLASHNGAELWSHILNHLNRLSDQNRNLMKTKLDFDIGGMHDNRTLLQAIQFKFELHDQINEIATDHSQFLNEHDTCLTVVNLMPLHEKWKFTKEKLTSAPKLTKQLVVNTVKDRLDQIAMESLMGRTHALVDSTSIGSTLAEDGTKIGGNHALAATPLRTPARGDHNGSLVVCHKCGGKGHFAKECKAAANMIMTQFNELCARLSKLEANNKCPETGKSQAEQANMATANAFDYGFATIDSRPTALLS